MCRKNLINQCYLKSDLCETKRKYPYFSGILNHEYQSEFFEVILNMKWKVITDQITISGVDYWKTKAKVNFKKNLIKDLKFRCFFPDST